MAKPPLRILLASPRGFCAGVDRAIQIVEVALRKYGAPVYVRHEIVHNRTVVEDLQAQGAVFVDELDQVPAGAPVVFSAHGVPKAVPQDAQQRKLIAVDATCPLVSKVHREAERHWQSGREVVLIGHAGHPEVIGTLGQLPAGAIHLIEDVDDAERFVPRDAAKLAYATQTTLSVEETVQVLGVLRRRFPKIAGPHREDICYATTNRQQAVKQIAPQCDAMVVLGAPNSSNSVRLVEVAKSSGCARAVLVQRAHEMDWTALGDLRTLGITAGASAPERIVQEVIDAFAARYEVQIEEVVTTTEDIRFRLPRVLEEA
jgi:4-hydroxy-3-methylbut-2-enyl diphosphate reductase